MKTKSTEEWEQRVNALHPKYFTLSKDIDEVTWKHDRKGTVEMIKNSHTQHTNDKLREVLEKVESKRWPISDRDEGMALLEKYGHNSCLDEIATLLKAEITDTE